MREEQEREGQILVQKMKQLQKEEELQNEVLL
jgi:predicted metal-binding protein